MWLALTWDSFCDWSIKMSWHHGHLTCFPSMCCSNSVVVMNLSSHNLHPCWLWFPWPSLICSSSSDLDLKLLSQMEQVGAWSFLICSEKLSLLNYREDISCHAWLQCEHLNLRFYQKSAHKVLLMDGQLHCVLLILPNWRRTFAFTEGNLCRSCFFYPFSFFSAWLPNTMSQSSQGNLWGSPLMALQLLNGFCFKCATFTCADYLWDGNWDGLSSWSNMNYCSCCCGQGDFHQLASIKGNHRWIVHKATWTIVFHSSFLYFLPILSLVFWAFKMLQPAALGTQFERWNWTELGVFMIFIIQNAATGRSIQTYIAKYTVYSIKQAGAEQCQAQGSAS